VSRHDVELEMPATWPPAMQALAATERDTVVAYQQARASIDRRGRDDIQWRIRPPPNPYAPAYEALLERTEALLHGHRLVGYHCTRLTPSEVDAVRYGGLKELSADRLWERVHASVRAGDLPREVAAVFTRDALLREHLDNRHGQRTGFVWLTPNRSALRESAGVFRFFQHWGGEVLYAGRERAGDAVGAALTRLGRPKIVQCAVALPIDGQRGCYGARFLSQLVADTVDYPEPPPSFDLGLRRDLPASEVLDIIDIDDARFEALTGYSHWPREHRAALA
jgi:hypothetical protein